MDFKKLNKLLFDRIYNYALKHPDDIYYIDNLDYEDAKYLGYEIKNNGLPKENIAYREYLSLCFKTKDEAFEITEYKLPSIIYTDEGEIFNYSKERLKCDNIQIPNIITLSFEYFNPLHYMNIDDIDFGSDILMQDEDYIKLFMEVKALLKKPYKSLPDGRTWYDEKAFKKTLEELKDKYKRLLKRADEINDGSYIIEDSLEPLMDTKTKIKGFSKADFSSIKNLKPYTLVNKGASYYVDAEYEKAFPYYLVAGLMGDEQAISNLGYCYMYGRSVDVNMDLAIACFSIAAAKGAIDANYKLATIYRYDNNLKNPVYAKNYFLRAYGLMMLDAEYLEYPSLALALAREKIQGDLFTKDLFGAYLLLKLAKRGYEIDLDDGFMPHEKQYNDVLNYLDSEMFSVQRANYIEGFEDTYLLSDSEMSLSEFTNPKEILIGDTAIALEEISSLEDEDLVTMPGTELKVTEILGDIYILMDKDDNEYYAKRNLVIKKMGK